MVELTAATFKKGEVGTVTLVHVIERSHREWVFFQSG